MTPRHAVAQQTPCFHGSGALSGSFVLMFAEYGAWRA